MFMINGIKLVIVYQLHQVRKFHCNNTHFLSK